MHHRNAYNHALFLEGDKRDSSSDRVLSEHVASETSHMTSYGVRPALSLNDLDAPPLRSTCAIERRYPGSGHIGDVLLRFQSFRTMLRREVEHGLVRPCPRCPRHGQGGPTLTRNRKKLQRLRERTFTVSTLPFTAA